MRKLKFISARASVEFNLDKPTPYVFKDLRGTGKPEILLLTSQSSTQDGETQDEAYYEPREMEFEGYVYGEDQLTMYQRLQELNAVIGSKAPLRVEYTNDYGSYYIAAMVTDPLEEDARVQLNGHYKPVSMTIHCSDPAWRALVGTEQASVAYRSGRFRFPFSIHSPGVTFGQGGYRSTVVNLGDVATGFEAWITGPAVTPALTNLTTGEFMAFSRALQVYETLYINTSPLSKTVEVINALTGARTKALDALVDVDVTGWEFWLLQPGSNDVKYDSGADDIASATVTLSWTSLFSGV